VEAVAPHRITLTHTQRRVPDYLAARLAGRLHRCAAAGD
jgi:hypothetical protein